MITKASNVDMFQKIQMVETSKMFCHYGHDFLVVKSYVVEVWIN